MWKDPIILMENIYPFGAISDPNAPKHSFKKKIPKNDKLLEKAQLIASLKHQCLIKLQRIYQEGAQTFLLFQYVLTSIQKWYTTVSREFIQNYEQKLILFSRYVADKCILTSFKRQNMGVGSKGEPKYYLDLNIEISSGIDKLTLKKKYKDEIKGLMQYYLEKKNHQKNQTIPLKPQITQKKQNSKIMKILQAIEKGKANLCSESTKELPKEHNKETSQALVSQQNTVYDSKTTLKPIKNVQNVQNVIIQRQVNKVNKIQVMVNNKAVDVLQHEFKRQFASSSYYLNGMPTVVLQSAGQERRLLSPNQKLSRFEEVKYKEYKSMKTSGEQYVQDFINVLQADDTDKLTLPGSPRTTIAATTKLALQSTAKNTSIVPKKRMVRPNSLHCAVEQVKEQPLKNSFQHKKVSQEQQTKLLNPKHGRSQTQLIFMSQKGIKRQDEGRLPRAGPLLLQNKQTVGNPSRINDLQKKVSQAIVNSLNAINKFKSAKIQLNP